MNPAARHGSLSICRAPLHIHLSRVISMAGQVELGLFKYAQVFTELSSVLRATELHATKLFLQENSDGSYQTSTSGKTRNLVLAYYLLERS